MAETLYIRLGSQAQDSLQWLILSNLSQEIIASGELKSADQLTQLTEKAKTRQVTVLVPGCDVALKSLKVPGNSQRAIKLATPYMLEDELAQEVEQLFFAYTTEKEVGNDNNCFAAVVERSQIKQWLAWLKDADISCKRMLPDVLAMPYADNQWSAIAIGEQMIVRQSLWQGMTLDREACAVISQQWLVQQKGDDSEAIKTINAYSPLPHITQGLELQLMPEELPLALLAQNASQQSFNLLQGEFLIKEQRSPAIKSWVWAAGIAVMALILNVGIKGAQLWQLSAQQQKIEQEIISTYKQAFPNSKRVRVATIKSQMNQKLKEIGGSSGQDGFLSMLAKVIPAFRAVPELKPDTLKFDGKRQEIRMQVFAKDYQFFDKFKDSLEAAELKVNLGAQNNQGDQVSGSFSISNKRGQAK